MGRRKDYTGQKFYKLLAIKPIPNTYSWLWLCECGNKKIIASGEVIRGKIRSCGCLGEERKKNFIRMVTTHGDSYKRLYYCWGCMRARCDNPNNKDYLKYGGQGIKYCKEWGFYENFKKWALIHGYKDNLTIDRINNNLGYIPSNCRWATRKEQARNRCMVKKVTFDGETRPIYYWADKYNISSLVIYSRIFKLKWRIDRALLTSVKKYSRV